MSYGDSWSCEGEFFLSVFHLVKGLVLSHKQSFPGISSFLNLHTHSPLARAMYNAIKHARLNDKFQDPLYLFLELVRAGVMHGHQWSGRAFSGGPSFGIGELMDLTMFPC